MVKQKIALVSNKLKENKYFKIKYLVLSQSLYLLLFGVKS
jgi:hypothetical protein